MVDNETLTAAIEGDRTSMEKVIQSFEGLVINQAHRFSNNNSNLSMDFDDYRQIGYEAIIRCVPKIDKNKLDSAVSFIVNSVKNSMRMESRRNRSRAYDDSLFDEVDTGILLIDTIQSDVDLEKDVLTRIDTKSILDEMENMEPEDRELISHWVHDPYGGIKKFCEKYGMPYRKTRYRKDLIIKNLRKVII